MKINKNKSKIIKPFRFTNNYNIDYSPYYMIDNGFYKFYDKQTMADFMIKYGIYCGAERRIENHKVNIYWYDNLMTEQQRDFIYKRGLSILQTLTYQQHKDKNFDARTNCGCKKKKRQQ